MSRRSLLNQEEEKQLRLLKTKNKAFLKGINRHVFTSCYFVVQFFTDSLDIPFLQISRVLGRQLKTYNNKVEIWINSNARSNRKARNFLVQSWCIHEIPDLPPGNKDYMICL